MIRNIVFDMGNVLLRFSADLFLDREGVTDPEDRKTILNELFRSVEWSMMDLGLLTEEEVEPRVLTRVPEHLKKHVSHLLYSWAEPRAMVEGMEELVRRLKSAGYGIYLLSNASVRQPDYWSPLPISRIFDGTLISAEVRLVKPMPEIYRLFTERFSLKPEECLFIDDFPLNVAAAIAEGWEGIVFHGDAAELEKKLREKGVTC